MSCGVFGDCHDRSVFATRFLQKIIPPTCDGAVILVESVEGPHRSPHPEISEVIFDKSGHCSPGIFSAFLSTLIVFHIGEAVVSEKAVVRPEPKISIVILDNLPHNVLGNASHIHSLEAWF